MDLPREVRAWLDCCVGVFVGSHAVPSNCVHDTTRAPLLTADPLIGHTPDDPTWMGSMTVAGRQSAEGLMNET
jgi:hypothetical protein